jgi:hypothetical protein
MTTTPAATMTPCLLSERRPTEADCDRHGRVWVFIKRYGWWLVKRNGEWAVEGLHCGAWSPKVDRQWLPYSALPDLGVEMREP